MWVDISVNISDTALKTVFNTYQLIPITVSKQLIIGDDLIYRLSVDLDVMTGLEVSDGACGLWQHLGSATRAV